MANPSFEILPRVGLPEHCGHGCSFSTAGEGIPGWTIAPGSNEFTGQFQPGTPVHNHNFFNFVPDGITTAYTDGGTISQVVGTVQEGEIYTLMVDLGHRKDEPFAASADLLVGGHEYMATGKTPDRGDWSTYTARFVGTLANVGDTITIQLNADTSQGNFDDVRITESPVPEPSSLLLLASGGLGLAQVLRRKLM